MSLSLTSRFAIAHLLLVFCLATTARAQEPAAQELRLTLQQALRIALEKNPALQQAANQVDSSGIAVAQRRSDFAPDLGVTLSGAERFDKELDLDGDRDSRNFETVSGTLGSSVNLFNGFGDVAALRGTEWEWAGTRDSYTREEQTLVFTTLTAFLQALGDRELIVVRSENLEGNRRQLEQVEALYRAGNRPVSDLYQQQAETGSAELDLLTAERNYVVAKLQLLQTIGLPPTTTVEPAAPDLAPLEAALVDRQQGAPDLAALGQRADLQAGTKQIEASREQVSEAQAGYWPTLDLSASINSDYTSLIERNGFSDQFFDDNANAAIGLSLAFPIFDRHQTRHQIAQARLRESNARLSLRQNLLLAEAELGQAVEDFRTAQKLVGVTESRLIAARQALAAVEERYRVGAATLVELTQSRALFAEAGYDRVRARFGLISRGAAIAYYQGDWPRLRDLLTLWENLP